MKSQNLILIVMGLLLSGCLVTRQQVRETVKSEPLSPEQQRRANNEVRYQEMDEQMRQMLGRVESVENSLNILNADKSGSHIENLNSRKDLNEKLKIYEEAIGKLEAQYLVLAQKVDALESSRKAPVAEAREERPPTGKGSYEVAEVEYARKKWKEAIVSFEKYRSLNPTGKRYGEATYKIGASFHELGMNSDAKLFFVEVIEKFPKSDWAKRAQAKLKALK